eukprot:gene12589-15813_t
MAVLIKDHQLFGRAAFAPRAYRQGEVVIREAPLLITGQNIPIYKKCMQILDALLVRSADWKLENGSTTSVSNLNRGVEQFLAWCMAPTAVQQRVLEDMHHSPGPNFQLTNTVLLTEWMALTIVKHLVPSLPVLLLQGSVVPLCNTDTITSILLAWELNSHSVGDSGLSMILTAQPEDIVTWQGIDKASGLGGCTVAEFKWTSRAKNLLTLQLSLRQNFAFDCACERCVLPVDDLRDLPCPRCVPRDQGKLPRSAVYIEDVTQGPKGVLTFHDKAVAGCGITVEGPYWQCSCCSLQLPNNPVLLFGKATVTKFEGRVVPPTLRMTDACSVEEHICYIVNNFDDELTATNKGNLDHMMRLLALVGSCMGPDHFTFIQALLFHAELMLMELRGIVRICRLEAMQAPLPWLQDQIQKAIYLVKELEDDWRRRLMFDALALVDVHANLCQALASRFGGTDLNLILVLDLASLLLDWAEPTLEKLRLWQAPEPYQMVVQLGSCAYALSNNEHIPAVPRGMPVVQASESNYGAPDAAELAPSGADNGQQGGTFPWWFSSQVWVAAAAAAPPVGGLMGMQSMLTHYQAPQQPSADADWQ